MKLVRYGSANQEKPGLVDDAGHIHDISHYVQDISGAYLTSSAVKQLQQLNLNDLSIVADVNSIRLGPCIGQVGKLICVAFNSRLHIEEMGQSVPDEVMFFLKSSSSITGPYDPIRYPQRAQKVDWEAELALIIGKQGKDILEEDAHEHILGYTCINDLSDRYWQFDKGGQHGKGKSFDSFAPLGPYLVTREHIEFDKHLRIRCKVNNQLRQDYLTNDYFFNPQQVISQLSHFFTLHVGDVIAMGTGPGNAKAWGNTFLKSGDEVEVEIENIGRMKNIIQ